MEKREIDPAKKKEVQRTSVIIVLAMTAVIAAYLIYTLVTKNLNIVLFEIMLSIFVVTYTVLNDVVEPKRLGLLDNMTIGQRDAYMKIIVLDVVGIGGLLYWIAGMSSEDGESLLPVLIYFLAAQMKRKFRPEFEGTAEEENEEAGDENAAEVVEETTEPEKTEEETDA